MAETNTLAPVAAAPDEITPADRRRPADVVRRMVDWLLETAARFAFLGAAFGSVVALFGQLAWPFELATHFPLQYFWLSLAAMTVFIWRRLFTEAAFAAALMGWNFWLICPSFMSAGAVAQEPPLRLLSVNVYAHNESYDRTLEMIREADADMVLAIEVSRDWGEALRALAAEYPHHHIVPDGGSGVALFSRRPWRSMSIEHLGRSGDNSVIAEFEIDGRAFTLVGAHPMAPYTAHHLEIRNRQLQAFADRIQRIKGPVVLLGDLNVTPWSPYFHRLRERCGLADSRRGFGMQTSWPTMFPAPLRIPIDHCLVSPEIAVVNRRVGPDIGSDHRPIIVDVTLGSTAD